MQKISFKYFLLIGWMILIFLLSAEGAEDSQSRSGVIVSSLKDTFSIDSVADSLLSFLTRKAAHIIAYLILGLLIYSIVKSYGLTNRRTVLLSIMFAFFYAIFDEIHQLFVPGRSGEVRDVFLDTIAASIGIGTYYLCNNIHYSRRNSKGRI